MRRGAGSRDAIFAAVVAAQVATSAFLGVAIVRAVDRNGATGAAGGQGPAAAAPSSAAPTAAPTGTAPSARRSSAGGGGGGTTGVSAGEIRVGGVFTLSGPGDATVAMHAAQAYFNMVNDRGGVHGRRITYVTRDDHFDPSIGYAAVKELVENERVFAMSSWVAPNTETQQTIDYLERRGVPLVGTFGQPPEYTSRVVYSFAANWPVSSRLTVRYLARTLGQKKIGLVWVHLSDQIDRIVTDNARAEARADGAEIVYTEAADVAKAVYDDTVIKARGAGATGMVTIMDAFSLSRYWQSFARTTWRPAQLGYAFALDPQPTQAVPAGYPDVYAIQEMELPSNGTAPVNEYLSTVKRYFPDEIDEQSWASELSWLGAKMFVEALRRAGPNPTREAVLAALDSLTRFDSGFAPPYTIRPGPHDFVTCMKAARLGASRRWVQVSDWFCL